MIRIRKPRRGEPITSEFIALLIDAINERDLLDSPSGSSGLRFINTPQGRLPKVTVRPGNAAAPDATLTPFQLVQGTLDDDGNIQPAPATNSFVFNQYSYFREDATSCNYTDITNLDSAISLTDGDSVWLQLDASDDGSELEEASIPDAAQTAPYEDDGNLITFGGSGTTADPYIWDQSFVPARAGVRGRSERPAGAGRHCLHRGYDHNAAYTNRAGAADVHSSGALRRARERALGLHGFS